MQQVDIEKLIRTFPIYLSDVSKISLVRDLESLWENNSYYANKWEGPSSPIQADGWNQFIFFDFSTDEIKQISGIICSNSCDIDVENLSLRDRNIIFAPILPISDYADMLLSAGIHNDRVEGQIKSIRRQEKTDIFYLPESATLPECVVMLDDIRSQPLSTFMHKDNNRRRLFRLNNFGFYIFLMKLSIHFTRFGENLDRHDPTGQEAVA